MMMNGFYMVVGTKGFFFENDGTNITDKVARAFINALCDYRGVGDEIRKKALYDKPTLKDFKYRISKASIEDRTTDSGYRYYSLKGNCFTESYPVEDFKNDIIVF